MQYFVDQVMAFIDDHAPDSAEFDMCAGVCLAV